MLQDKGKKSPLDDIPESDFECDWFLKIFTTLSASRGSNGFGPNPISISEIIAYLSSMNIVRDFESTLYILQNMDAEYIKSLNKEDNN